MADDTRSRFAEIVRIEIAGVSELMAKYADPLRARGMHVQRDVPPAVGEFVLVEFYDPAGRRLLAATSRVVHSRPASVPGERTAGMGLELLEFDEPGRRLIAQLDQRAPAVPAEPPLDVSTGDSLAHDTMDAGPIVGIDLGTTNSCVAFVEKGEPRILATAAGHESIPSVIHIDEQRTVLAGHRAMQKMVYEPRRCVYGSKRFIGRLYASREVHSYGHFFHYDLAPGKSGLVAARVGDTLVPLEVVAAHVLGHLKIAAEEALGFSVRRAVITVPAYFGATQRRAVKEAGQLAGFEVERVLNEPTAAAVAYGYGRDMSKTVLVYDFGGGTFDASAMRIAGDTMEVLATDGDPFLGGSDLDDRLTEFVLMNVERTENLSLRSDPVSVQRIRFAAEEAKRELSEVDTAVVQVPYLTSSGSPTPINVSVPVTRDLFEDLTEDLVSRTLTIVQSVLDAAGLTTDQLDDIVMVGGQSRSPAIRRLLTERFGRQPSRNIHPDHAIALGAALVAAAATDASVPLQLEDILERSIRLARPDSGTEVLVPRGSPLPAEKTFGVSASTDGETEFRVILYRGEAEVAEENEVLGELRIPGSLALAVSRTEAPVTLSVSVDGILSVVIQHPLSKTRERLELSLPEGAGAEAVEVDMLDVIELVD
jgi:molecular chaperone DnaK